MMVKELEKSGKPVVHITAMTPVSQAIGVNRILQATGGIPSPMCDPKASEEEQAQQRYRLISTAVKALSTDIKEQTVFY